MEGKGKVFLNEVLLFYIFIIQILCLYLNILTYLDYRSKFPNHIFRNISGSVMYGSQNIFTLTQHSGRKAVRWNISHVSQIINWTNNATAIHKPQTTDSWISELLYWPIYWMNEHPNICENNAEHRNTANMTLEGG